ncbi:hypothetical protein RRG08_059568 [Elysia crispata]|uniref:Major facilitator superfamily (MFS) profile domain-containing protein n=1 Tax=Elysia crispata TaxID=231223 RepID=A0AAE0YID5_9GAST|nr:hypothetical protein RRG08_059568 [Elysia crispata]
MTNSSPHSEREKEEGNGLQKEVEEEEKKPLAGVDKNNGKKTSQPDLQQTTNGKRRKVTTADDKEQGEDVPIENLEEYIPTPPDGGWGWVVVLAAMLGNFIVDGIAYGFGVFLVPLVKAFNEPKRKVSLVGSLLPGVYLLSGGVVSAMTNKFGCRPVVIVGTIVSFLAFIAASQTTNIDVLIFTYGVMGGFGLGMIYLPCIVIVNYYFEKRRGLANGIAVSGSGVGTFAYSPLSEILLSEYQWHGALLIIAGVIFNGCICGALMRPLKAKPRPKAKSKTPREKNLLDRLKESTNGKNRTVSECSRGKIREGLLEAKLERENRLQDADSEIGSLSSMVYTKGRLDSTSDHRRLSEPHRNYKLSISSTNDSTISPVRGPGSGAPGTPTITIETGRPEGKDKQEVKGILPGPESITKASSAADEDASTDKSDYFTPPLTPGSTNPNSPQKEVSVLQPNNGSVKKVDTQKIDSTDNGRKNNVNGAIHSSPCIAASSPTTPTHASQSGEFSPLLTVPDPSIAVGHDKGRVVQRRNPSASGSGSGGPGGSRTNMSHLSSMRSLHVSKKDLARPLYRKDIFYSGSVLNIPQFQSQTNMKSYITSITTIPGESEFVDGPSGSSKFFNKCCSCLPRSARDVLAEMIDVSLFKDLSFMLICVGNILTFLGFFIPFMFIVDCATELGVGKKEAAFLVSIIGITNTVGRVVIGKLADLKKLDSLIMAYLSIFLCGLVTAIVPLCKSYVHLAIVAALFGLGVAGFVSLSSIIICDRMGLDKLTNGFGLLCMVRGVGTIAGPPLAGAMYDSTGSYDLPFLLGGLLMFAGGGCHMLLHLPCLSKKQPINQEFQVEKIEEITDVELHQLAGQMGSRPKIITLEDAMCSV